MARKIIIDCDPGIDDAVAICLALFDPRVEVLGITATAGRIDADQATGNVQAIVNHLDPPKYPRIGAAQPIEFAPVENDLEIHGNDGLGDFGFASGDRQHRQASDKVIGEILRQYPGQVSLVCLGPLTNVARAFQRDPGLEEMVDRVIISGGSVRMGGNITAAAEFNMFFDPDAAQSIFHSATTKSLLPLDVTESVLFGLETVDDLPPKYTRAGSLLHKLISFSFRNQHQRLGRELIPLQDPVALLAAMEPDLFSWEEMAGDVETQGVITRGATIFDRRQRRGWQNNMEVATEVDQQEIKSQVLRGLRYAGQQT
jgi:inosine-uridine nucleoside N-ribohydrolase